MKHEWDKIGLVCSRCGVTERELYIGDGDVGYAHGTVYYLQGPCTGNAYVCRVARKLEVALDERHPKILTTKQINGAWTGMRPWTFDGDELRSLIDRVIHKDRGHDFIYPKYPSAVPLLAAIKSDPTVCPILADSLQAAGCEDAALLEALRTL